MLHHYFSTNLHLHNIAN